VTIYNYGRFLPTALDSLLGQSVPFDQIIVVDDGSTDETPEVLSRYEGRVQAIRIENSGQLGACVEGLKYARSEYVYVLDADDYIPRDFLREIKTHLVDEPDKVQFQLTAVDEAGRETGSVFPTYPPVYGSPEARADNEAMGFYICPPTSGNLFRRSVFEKMDFSRMATRAPFDGTPVLVIPYLGSIKSLNRPMAFYRIHGNSDSQWGNPTKQVLERELNMYYKRRDEAASAVGKEIFYFKNSETAYALERSMMLAALNGKMSPSRTILKYIRKISASNLPTKQKIVLSGWALSFSLPGAAMRQYAVRIRRSPSSRPRLLQQAVRRLLRA